MKIEFTKCDLNNDYFHFTKMENVPSILENGLIPKIGIASKMVNDRANVSISKGGKGILGIINSFVYKFSNLKINEIPLEYRHYFEDIDDFNSNEKVGMKSSSYAMKNKLSEEVYLRLIVDDNIIQNARIGGLTGFDINLEDKIDKSCISIITDESGIILSAYDVILKIYEKIKDNNIFREMNESLFYMIEECEKNLNIERKI